MRRRTASVSAGESDAGCVVIVLVALIIFGCYKLWDKTANREPMSDPAGVDVRGLRFEHPEFRPEDPGGAFAVTVENLEKGDKALRDDVAARMVLRCGEASSADVAVEPLTVIRPLEGSAGVLRLGGLARRQIEFATNGLPDGFTMQFQCGMAVKKPWYVPGKYDAIVPIAAPSMVLIPAGTFWMGCSPGDSECDGDENPRHQVTISKPFSMDVHEVTQGEYQRVIGTNPSYFKNCGSDCPVEQVSWADADAYCRKVGKRLPTEAEWEYAARGGRDGEIRYGELDAVAWYSQNSGSSTHPVGQKQANGYGLYDMLGNVWEWTADWYGGYPSGQVRDPKGPGNGTRRVLRGGGWAGDARDARASGRGRGTPVNRATFFGFRCSRD